jgi:hypothetical protein
MVVVVELGDRCLLLRRRFKLWFVALVMSDEVLCGEAVTLALDLLMTCAFGFLDISFSDPLSNLRATLLLFS